jgi:hypothetical protein
MMTRTKMSNLHRAAARTLPPCAAVDSSAEARSIALIHRENLSRSRRRFACPRPQNPDSHNNPAPVHDSNPI